MGKKQVLVVVAVPVVGEYCGNLVFGVAVGKGFGVSDVLVVDNTAVFCYLLVVGREDGVHLVFVAVV